MSKSVNYHPEPGRVVEFNVLSENPDKTVNIGVYDADNDGKAVVIVGNCRITDEIEIGAATLKASEPEKPKASNQAHNQTRK